MDSFRIDKVIPALIIILFSATLLAQDLDSIYQGILNKYNSINTYQADFEQENYWPELDVTKRSSGKVFYNKTNFLLSYSEPSGQSLLLNENYLTLLDIDNEQMFITDRIDQELRPDKLISSYWNSSTVNLISDDDILIVLNILNEYGENILVTLEDYLIRELTFSDKSENRVRYVFSNVVLDQKLDETVFILEIPEDIDIFDNRSNLKESKQ